MPTREPEASPTVATEVKKAAPKSAPKAGSKADPASTLAASFAASSGSAPSFVATKAFAIASRAWFVVDAADKPLGRLSSEIASVLRGKHKPTYTPHEDTGDFVVVVNADKVRLTGSKLDGKLYYRHSGIPGGFRRESYRHLLERDPTFPIEKAVKGMLPKNVLGRQMLTKLKLYATPDHPHAAQNPQPLTFKI